MAQLESAILQRFQDINKRKNEDDSDEDNEDSSSDVDSDWVIYPHQNTQILYDDNLLHSKIYIINSYKLYSNSN